MKFDPDVYPILEKISKHSTPEDFEAHEVWEFQWKKETGDCKLFIQSLIQISVAMNKIYVNVNLVGALSQTNLALEKLKLLEENISLPSNAKNFLASTITNLNLLVYLLTNELEYTTYLPPEFPDDCYLFFIS